MVPTISANAYYNATAFKFQWDAEKKKQDLENGTWIFYVIEKFLTWPSVVYF